MMSNGVLPKEAQGTQVRPAEAVPMTYGVKPEGMADADWTLECQARMVVREMRQCATREERRQVFECWAKLPGVTQERVQRIWKDGSDK